MDSIPTQPTMSSLNAVPFKGEWEGHVLADGRFLILDLLGSGGMADVYRGWDKEAKCDVAIKVPKRMLLNDASFLDRFEREIKLSARLRHGHIVPVLDCGIHKHMPYAVFAYCAGGSLKERLIRRGPPSGPPTMESLRWLAQIASALDFLHAQGFLHRDIKPDNILFNPHGKALLGDFGVARALNPNPEDGDPTALTDPNVVLGTFEYMSPELILGQTPLTGAIDQYSLAVTVYEVLSGRTPFRGNPQLVMVQHTQMPPIPLSEIRSDIPKTVCNAVQRALAKDPNERFPDCASLSREVLGGLHTRSLLVSANTSRDTEPMPPCATVPHEVQAGKAKRDWLWWGMMGLVLALGVVAGVAVVSL